MRQAYPKFPKNAIQGAKGRIIIGIGLIMLGLYMAIAPLVHIISAGTVGFQKYDPFETLPPLLMALIVLFGAAIAIFGVILIYFVFEKKSTPVVQELKICPYCGAKVSEKGLDHHMTNKCPKRATITK